MLLGGCDEVFDLTRVQSVASLDAVVGACPEIFAGGRYHYSTAQLRWLPAEAYCKGLDDNPDDGYFTHLAILNDPGEILDVGLPATAHAYVGYTDRRANTGPMPIAANFRWITDEPVLSVVWAANEPDSLSEPPYCAFVPGDDLAMHDSGCDTTPHEVLCECDTYAENPENIYAPTP